MPFLDWVNKTQAVSIATDVPYHLLQFQSAHGDASAENLLIQGDNLLALKALLPFYRGKVKCICIDPPYNTQSAFTHYDDKLEHSQWLTMMYSRLVLLRELLADDGSIWVFIDDREAHYLKVLMDEVFGRASFLNQVSVKMKQTAGASGGGEDKRLKKNIEYILIYARNKDGDSGFKKFNDVYDEEDLFEVIEDMRAAGKSWKYTRIIKSFGQKQYLKTILDGAGEPIKIYVHSGVVMVPITQVAQGENISEQECYVKYFDHIFRDTNAQSSIRTRVMEAVSGQGAFFSIEYVPKSGKNKGREVTLYYKGDNCDLIAWLKDVAVKKGTRLLKLEKTGTYWDGFPLNNLTKEGGVLFPQGKKPEALIQKVLELTTETGDLVLDSFGGSGTTGAVAQKMGRRWIMVEIGEHCHTHIIPRLEKVITANDTGGITKVANWQGGGGFRFHTLGEPVFDADGGIHPNVRFSSLAGYLWHFETGEPLEVPSTPPLKKSGEEKCASMTKTGEKTHPLLPNMVAEKESPPFEKGDSVGVAVSLSPLLGIHNKTAYYLLYNGILGDRRPQGGNVLTSAILAYLDQTCPHQGPRIIYGETTRLGEARLREAGITFKQIPYDIKAR